MFSVSMNLPISPTSTQKKLSRIRGIDPASHSTFSNANRTCNPDVMGKFFWIMYEHFRSNDAEFVHCKRKGKLSRFKLKHIYTIDSTTLQITYWCFNWAKQRQHKAAVKVHMVANVASRLPHFCVYGKANEHDSKKEKVLFESLNAGDIGIICSYSRFVAVMRAVTWLKKDLMDTLYS